jgi:uncharacterized 2Fe-2S/4Fe-4S cluster protein (DUF4445 family)
MKEILIKDNFAIQIEPGPVLQLIQCYKDNPIYEEVLEEFEELKPIILGLIKPKAVICFTVIDEEYAEDILPKGSNVLYSIITVGEKAGHLGNGYFAEGEYLKGMLADAMADACLFAMEDDLKEWIRTECRKRNCGVNRRYEAPVNIPMEVQKIAYEETKAKENLGLKITSGYMFDPVKSNCQVFRLTGDIELFHLDHDCRECDNVNCKVRNVPHVNVTVVTTVGEKVIACKENETLLEALTRGGIYISAVCGGNGSCGSCKITLAEGELEITRGDYDYFTEKELEEGLRLSCQAHPKVDCKILLQQKDESDFEILSNFKIESNIDKMEAEENYSFGIDIGTTTLAISLVGNSSKRILDTYSHVNGQRQYGADVISRMQASVKGKDKELKFSIQKDLLDGIKELVKNNQVSTNKIKAIVIAGNTTMGHLLLGFDCSKLGIYPFTPVDIGLIRKSFIEVFEDSYLDCSVTLLPGISTYVGADIVSGLYFCDFHQNDKINLLIDLGTNGEMAIGNRKKILTTSTAAGPAFEGGNITWGTGSIQGAISGVTLQRDGVVIRTIGDKAPLGICGTGVIETASEFVKENIIDETGLMIEEYFEEGFPLAKTPEGKTIVFNQKDIRELQLAKSAIRAGVETLLIRYGVNYDQVEKVYLAGGFGFKMDLEKAIIIGMLPKAFEGKIEAVGNSSLGGAVKFVTNAEADKSLEHVLAISTEINLANDRNFNDFYMDYMFFEE